MKNKAILLVFGSLLALFGVVSHAEAATFEYGGASPYYSYSYPAGYTFASPTYSYSSATYAYGSPAAYSYSSSGYYSYDSYNYNYDYRANLDPTTARAYALGYNDTYPAYHYPTPYYQYVYYPAYDTVTFGLNIGARYPYSSFSSW